MARFARDKNIRVVDAVQPGVKIEAMCENVRTKIEQEKQNLCRLVRFLQGARFRIEFICSTHNGNV